MNRQESRPANIVLAIGGLNGLVSMEVQNSTFVLRLKFSAKNPLPRKAAGTLVAILKDQIMNKVLLLFLTFLTLACNGQDTMQDKFILTISPIVNQNDQRNQKIIEALAGFLKTKNSSLTENLFWVQSDFQKFIYPYLDIHNIENSKYGKDFYQPTLVDIIPTENSNQKIVKLAFIGHNQETKENQLKSIYNLVANIQHDKILFSRYLDLATKEWETINSGSLTYKLSPSKAINKVEIAEQQKDINKICNFFSYSPIAITYYSCINPKGLFEIKGFDYHPMMYADKSGGLADYGNIIFSGNNSEIYTHEIVHIYSNNIFPRINQFLDEGLATFLAGSGKYNYEWHRNKFKKFLDQNKNFNFTEHTDAYERMYFENETPIPYLISALIIERTLQTKGNDKLLKMLKSEKELWETLETVGLTKSNLNKELRKQLEKPFPIL